MCGYNLKYMQLKKEIFIYSLILSVTIISFARTVFFLTMERAQFNWFTESECSLTLSLYLLHKQS